jgi:predicted phage terminase large subunit-like protein
MLKGAGGILTKCKRTFGKAFEVGKDYDWKEKDGKFVFYDPEVYKTQNGKKVVISEVYLKHSEHEANIEEYWQGVEANLICLDETTQYTLPMVQYIMSRMRNPSCETVRPHIKMTCNPMYNHFLRKWVEPYLKEDGTPDRSKDGLIRYFQMHNGDFFFGDSREEVAEHVGCELSDVLTFTFISATVDDNTILKKIDPKYVSWLKGLKGVQRKRLLEGNWYAKEEGSSYFSRSWVTELTEAPPATDFVRIVRYWDLAGNLPTDANRSPDYTASTKIGKLRTGDYVVLENTRTRIRFGEWKKHILEHAQRDGTKVEIIIPQDPNPQAKSNAVALARSIIESGYRASTRRSAQGKLEDFKPFSAAAQLGVVYYVKDCSFDYFNKINGDNDFVYDELEAFDGLRRSGESGHDDLADTSGGGFLVLAARVHIGSGFIKGVQDVNTSTNHISLLSVRK